jgi:hypothetical protein
MLILWLVQADRRDRTVRADVEWAPHVGQDRPSRCWEAPGQTSAPS